MDRDTFHQASKLDAEIKMLKGFKRYFEDKENHLEFVFTDKEHVALDDSTGLIGDLLQKHHILILEDIKQLIHTKEKELDDL